MPHTLWRTHFMAISIIKVRKNQTWIRLTLLLIWVGLSFDLKSQIWYKQTSQSQMAVCQNLVPLVNIKIAGKWMFIPLKMVLIGIDPYPDLFKKHRKNATSSPPQALQIPAPGHRRPEGTIELLLDLAAQSHGMTCGHFRSFSGATWSPIYG